MKLLNIHRSIAYRQPGEEGEENQGIVADRYQHFEDLAAGVRRIVFYLRETTGKNVNGEKRVYKAGTVAVTEARILPAKISCQASRELFQAPVHG